MGLAGLYAAGRSLDAARYTGAMRRNDLTLTAVLTLLFAAPLWSGAADLEVTQAWARPTPPAAQVGAVYLSITNRGEKADQLLSLSTEVAGSVEIHDTQTVNGVMQMRPVASVICPARATVKVQPGGLHVMLLGLKQPLIEGNRFELTLRFRDAGALLVQVPVQNGM
jgi:copper(I)-binding protein